MNLSGNYLHRTFPNYLNWCRILILATFWTGNLLAQPAVEWDKVQPVSMDSVVSPTMTSSTPDGGVIMGLSSVLPNSDFYIIKFDENGIKQWQKVYTGDRYDVVTAITPTSDGGYLLGGYSNSGVGGDKTEPAFSSSSDYWIIKITADGTKQWDKTFGGTGQDELRSIKQTADGGYILGGISYSPANEVKSENSLDLDYWVIKISVTGTKEWDKTIGGTNWDYLTSVDQTADGGFILAGTSFSEAGGSKTALLKGNVDYWIVRLSADGSKLWDQSYGGYQSDDFVNLQRTADGGYLLAGTSNSAIGADKSKPSFDYSRDYWIVKINSDGEKQWDKVFGGTGYDYVSTFSQTTDGGYLLGGWSNSVDGNKTAALKGIDDYWIMRLNADGNKIWDKSIGGDKTSTSRLKGAYQAPDGGYTFWGTIYSDGLGGDKTQTGSNIWIVKILSESNNKKLVFSAETLDFTISNTAPDSSRTVSLSASTGVPEIELRKSTADWLDLPSPAPGLLPFTVTTAGVAPNQYSSIVAATAPGYARALLNVNLVVVDAAIAPELSPIGDKVLLQGGRLKFTAAASAGNGQIKVFSLLNAPAGATINAATGAFNWLSPWETGNFQLTIRVAIAGFPDLYDQETIVVKVVKPADFPVIRINAGGQDFTTADGRVFMADTFFVDNTRTSTVKDVDIVNTQDDELYRSSRCDNFIEYRIPVQPGIYKVTLHFAEVFWGVYPGKPGNASSRLMDVYAEGEIKLPAYSILQKAGGPLRAVKETFEISVPDGLLNLDFNHADADRPKVAAIEVEAITPLSELSLGPVADAYVRYGSSAQTNYGLEQTIDVKATNKAELERMAYIKFSLASLSEIRSAKFRIYGQNYQFYKPVQVSLSGIDNDNWFETGITASNAPTGPSTFLGSFPVRHHEQFFEVDITEFAKGQFEKDKTLTLTLADLFSGNRRVIFNSRENAVNPPELIIVTSGPVTPTARLAQTEILTDTDNKTENELAASTIYPNPVQKHFTVQIGNQHKDNITLQLISAAGRSYPVKTKEELHAGSKAEADISGLSLGKGIYLLKVQSSNTSEVLKVLITE